MNSFIFWLNGKQKKNFPSRYEWFLFMMLRFSSCCNNLIFDRHKSWKQLTRTFFFFLLCFATKKRMIAKNGEKWLYIENILCRRYHLFDGKCFVHNVWEANSGTDKYSWLERWTENKKHSCVKSMESLYNNC